MTHARSAAPPATTSRTASVMRGTKRPDTVPERTLRSRLHRAGLRYRVDLLLRFKDARVRPDVVFPRARVAVFIDGCFWHGCPEHFVASKSNTSYWSEKLARNISRDRRDDTHLAANGWRVVRVWEHETPDAVLAKVQAAVRAEPPALPRKRCAPGSTCGDRSGRNG